MASPSDWNRRPSNTRHGAYRHAARHRNRRRGAQRLVDDAVALGEPHQGGELLLGQVAVELEASAGCRGSRPARPWRRRACRGSRGRPRRGCAASRTGSRSAVATAFSVTPAQATSASSSMSPEQALMPLPPVAGCSPASTSALPVCDRAGHALADPPLGLQRDHGRLGRLAVALLERGLQGLERSGVHGAILIGVGAGKFRPDGYRSVQDIHRPRLPCRQMRMASSLSCEAWQIPLF